jgi:hypothetical protein
MQKRPYMAAAPKHRMKFQYAPVPRGVNLKRASHMRYRPRNPFKSSLQRSRRSALKSGRFADLFANVEQNGVQAAHSLHPKRLHQTKTL